MRGLSAAELLTVWERGFSKSTAERGLILLAIAHPEEDIGLLAQMSIGQRNAQLMTLREQTLGAEMLSVVTCPSCRNTLELNFTVADILQPINLQPADILSLRMSDYQIKFRLPNSEDLIAISAITEISDAAKQLRNRCVLEATYHEQMIAVDELPDTINQSLIKRMEQIDPHADIQLRINCPYCGHSWDSPFDILAFFWQELTVWAHRLLREVHQLAFAYGWREVDILAMSPQRRKLYLEMIG